MVTNNHNEVGLDITELPTDEYPVLRESALPMAREAPEPSRAEHSSAESTDEPVRAASELAELEAKVSRLHGNWQSIEAEFGKRETQITLLHEELRARDERIAALSKALADADIEHKDSVARAEVEAARLDGLVRQEQAATAGVASRNQQLLAEQELLRGKLQDLEIYINGRHDRWSALNAELAASKSAVLEMEETVKARDAVIAQHDEEKRQLAASIHDVERQCSELAGRRKEREEAYDDLQKTLATHFAQAEQLRTEYANHTKETELAAKNALDTQQRIESLETGIKRRDEDIAALRNKVEQGALAIGELTTAKTALGTRIDELEKELAERSRQLQVLGDERDTAQKESARIRAELDTLSAHAIELGRLRGEAVAEAHHLTLALTAQQKLGARLETEIRAKQATVDALERSVERITDLGASLAALDQQMNSGNGKRDVELQPVDLLLDDEPDSNVVDIGERTKIEAGRKLVVTIGGRAFDYAILKKDVTIGRGHDSDIRIESHFISRIHARICTNGPATIIEDAGSKNGVLVNSKRVLRRVLRDGDVVNLGDDSSLRFVDATH